VLPIPEKYFIYLVVFLVASCAPSGGSDTSKNSIIVYNKSSYTVVAVYISSTSSFGWGSDWLKNDTIRPNSSRTFGGIECNESYDIRVITTNDYIDFFDVFLLCGDELGEILIYNLR